MTTMTVPSADLSDADAPGRVYRTWFVGVVAGGLGILFGIALTIGTVVIPRMAELRRETVESTTVSSISVEGAMKVVDPKVVWLGKQETQDINYGYGWPKPNSKGFQGMIKVPQAEQAGVIDRLIAQLLADLQKSKGVVQILQSENSNYVAGSNQMNALRGYTYAKVRGAGSIRVWGMGRGNELTIVVTISER